MKSSKCLTQRRGIALITVLALLTLLALLVLSILFTSRVERKSSSLFSSSIEARTLAESSVNLCIGQIRDATVPFVEAAGPGEEGGTTRQARAWVSQPGLLRTFRGNRQPDTSYRLYSWSQMRVDGDFDPYSDANRVPPDWKANPALYVDLNEPVPNSDPDLAGDPARDFYPILYPPELMGNGSVRVVGYRVPAEDSAIPGATGTEGITPVPMPVQWLYVLKNGQICDASAQAAGRVRVNEATAENPIVGRIAFWGDDESAKVNINTAAGGFGWWTPWFETPKEHTSSGTLYGMGFSQPVRNEYQRYPGHPARTSLLAIFPELDTAAAYIIAPRIEKGPSNEGKSNTVASKATRLDSDRFYTSLGELNFHANARGYPEDYSGTGWRMAMGEAFPTNIVPSVWQEMVERRKGFLTTSSRAPELTLFGTPRVAVWPISTNKNPTGSGSATTYYRSPVDHLIAFCSTLRSGSTEYPFYFTRATGGSGGNSSMSADADILRGRNNLLYHYLQRLTGKPFPGMGNTAFGDTSRYGALGRDQILTEVFDYIRTTNLSEMTRMPTGRDVTRYTLTNAVRPTRYDAGNGETGGFGRAFAVRQVGFQFICTADPDANADSNYVTPESGDPALPAGKKGNHSLDTKLHPGERRIQALFLVELFSPSAGFKMFYNSGPNAPFKAAIKVSGLEELGLEVDGTRVELGFPAAQEGDLTDTLAGARVGSDSWGGGTGARGTFGNAGGAVDYRWLFSRGYAGETHDVRTTGKLASTFTGTNYSYPYVSLPVTVTVPANGLMKFEGGTIRIEIHNVGSSYQGLLNTVEINLADVTLPIPVLNADPAKWAFHQLGIYGDGAPVGRLKADLLKGELIQTGDTVQTYILPHGDYRSLFVPGSPLNAYIPVPAADDTVAFRHVLPAGAEFAAVGRLPGTTLSEAAPSWAGHWAPAMLPRSEYATRLGGAVNAPWTFYDWDTGSPMRSTDGPLINKPDEGGWRLGSKGPINSYQGELVAYDTVAGDLFYQSANRQIPSPIMFGSLPTGLVKGDPWQTLLFRPDPGGHPGAGNPPDHLLLDLFWMPVVEPYAISEPFSTGGKINMNYQMIPFTYIERTSGLHAILENEHLFAVPETNWPDGYGKLWSATQHQQGEFYHAIDVEETLKPFRERFALKTAVSSVKDRVFLTPSEITEHYIVAEGETYESMPDFWERHRLTGENIRERIYAELYPRLTTRSNVFNIHYRVQTLRKPPGGDPTLWEESADNITSELRGNTMIERYLDMNRDDIPDFASAPSSGGEEPNAENLYRFRVLTNREFNP